MNRWVDSIFNAMSADEKIGQLFMLTTNPASAYRAGILKNISEQKIGGVLFSKGTVEDQAESTNLFQNASRIPLLISFDGEWGLSMRLENTPRFPKNMMLGAVTDHELLTLYGAEMGRECRELGVHINFAPVLDVNNNPDNPVIGTRSFGENPQSVSDKGIAYAKGLESQKVIAVGKHFPGHGDTSDDSHKTLPLINHNKAHLDEVELYPFSQFIQAGFAGVMTGHLSVPALDNQSKLPTSLSPKIVNGLLKNELGFTGLAFTDALAMKGAGSAKNSVCVDALLAGNDILLNPTSFTTEYKEVKKAIASGVLEQSLIDEKCRKILQYKYIVGLNRYKPVDTKNLSHRINSDSAAWLVQKLNNEAITLLKNRDNKIPLKQLGEKKIAVLALGSESGREFHKKLTLYGKFDFFSMNPVNTQEVTETLRQLKNYDVVICEIYSVKEMDFPELQSLTKEKEVHFCFFTPPYSLGKYKQSITGAHSVILAYEDTDAAQKAAAEIIMGGIPAKGKLPVTISDMFEPGTGLETQKVRLSYQHPIEKNMSGSTLDQIELIVKEGIENQAFPGCQVLVAKEGVVVYNKSFGFFDYANHHPVEDADVYDLASVTKALATLPALMKLFDTKKISLTDKISRFVPELKDTDKEGINIREALFHESRLPAFISFYNLLIDKDSYSGRLTSSRRDRTFHVQYDTDVYARTDYEFYPDLVSKTPQPNMELQVAEDFFISNDFKKVVLNEIANAVLKKSNGYLYSDLNFMLLKEVVESVSNRSLDLFLQSQFYAGLGANYTDFRPLRKIKKEHIAPTEHDKFWRKQVITGYPHDEAAAVMGGISGNAGLFSNANDLAKLLQMFLYEGEYGGEKFLTPETVKTFTQTKSPRSRRGLGFDKPDMTSQSKSPAGDFATASTYGHTGYTGTCFWVDPDNQLIYVFLSNRVYPSRTHSQLSQLKIRGRIQNVIYEAMN
jgi:beta-glucosidase-like glycosyl hydrolase/CubicO group peptidase (beta-lactamase class C family)